jgi:hypothetical protein
MKAADPAGAQRLRARALARLDALVGTGRCGFRVRPVIPIADDLACPPGPATLRPVHPAGIPLDLPSNHRFTTGRLSSSDLTVDQPTVSRQHAVMFQHGGRLVRCRQQLDQRNLRQPRSRCGEVRLAGTDEIRPGAIVRLRFELSVSPTSPT